MSDSTPEAETVILMPTFNQPDYLPQAVASVMAQRYTDWMLMVINDGGTPVEPVLRPLNDPRIRVLDMPHAGKASALNAGIAASDSAFIAYLDDDDYFLPNHLELLVKALKEEPSRQAACSRTVAEYWPGRPVPGQPAPRKGIEYDCFFNTAELRIHNTIPNLNVVHRRSLFEEVGVYDPNLPFYIDWDMLRRFSYVAGFHGVPAVTGVYRRIAAKEHLSRSPRAADPVVHAAVRNYVASKWPALSRQFPMTWSEPPARARGSPGRPAETGALILPSPPSPGPSLEDLCVKQNIPFQVAAGDLSESLARLVHGRPGIRRVLTARNDLACPPNFWEAHAFAPPDTVVIGACQAESTGSRVLDNMLATEPGLACGVCSGEQPPGFCAVYNEQILFNASWPLDVFQDALEGVPGLPAESCLVLAWLLAGRMIEHSIPCLYDAGATAVYPPSRDPVARYRDFERAGRWFEEYAINRRSILSRMRESRAASRNFTRNAEGAILAFVQGGGCALEHASEQQEEMLPVFHRECCESAFFDHGF